VIRDTIRRTACQVGDASGAPATITQRTVWRSQRIGVGAELRGARSAFIQFYRALQLLSTRIR
jgi:hypothetical protein